MKKVIIVVLFLVSFLFLTSEQVILNNGDEMNGRITGKDRDKIYLKLDKDGSFVSIYHDLILSILDDKGKDVGIYRESE